MYSEQTVLEARKICQCCPDCSDYPCEGSLNWDGWCEKNRCICDYPREEDRLAFRQEE